MQVPVAVERILNINVTTDDITNSEQSNTGRCAIAHAIHRQYPHYLRVFVGKKTIRLSDPNTETRYKWATPPTAQDFITKFDRGEDVETIEVKLDKVHAIREGVQKSKPGSRRNDVKKVKYDVEKEGRAVPAALAQSHWREN